MALATTRNSAVLPCKVILDVCCAIIINVVKLYVNNVCLSSNTGVIQWPS